VPLFLIKHHPAKTNEEMEIYQYEFLTAAVSGQLQISAVLLPGKESVISTAKEANLVLEL
jgi:hypothetical protein